ncbi:hypothetical protein CROQUDRAFT_661821 [Cronartium quercuum f. sp. fusiforme G11]|uniref:Uncharacterized protein n=1 Tax=Cronartium quercuum f. sp. fusiforme G11 TaxID=708437 RepID=A0A9P6T8E0_9BASI|nr:hypothetical protein CROQUDRAFT_661821 [Cronartium quercuum f. sp. fusiforme G11]
MPIIKSFTQLFFFYNYYYHFVLSSFFHPIRINSNHAPSHIYLILPSSSCSTTANDPAELSLDPVHSDLNLNLIGCFELPADMSSFDLDPTRHFDFGYD